MSECSHREFLLAALRAASFRAKLFAADIDTIGIALKEQMITAEEAVKWIIDAGLKDSVGKIPDEIANGETENG